MAELETAEEFARRLLGRCCDDADWGDKDALPAATFVEADRKAVALRALDELEARIREQQFKRVDPAWRQLLPILLREARAKYKDQSR